MPIRDLRAAYLNSEALRLRRSGMKYKEIARTMGNMTPTRARSRALEGLRKEAIRLGKRYPERNHDTYLHWC